MHFLLVKIALEALFIRLGGDIGKERQHLGLGLLIDQNHLWYGVFICRLDRSEAHQNRYT